MKISMFTNTYLPHVGGVARSVSTFVEDLRLLGHTVQIVAPTFADMEPDSDDGIVRVPAIQNFNGSDFSVRIPLPGLIDDVVTDFDPDIIHSHHPFLLGDAALRSARAADLPLVFTHHTLYENYTHYVPLDSDVLKRFVIKLATEYANLCNHVIAPSVSVKNLLLERGVKSSVTVLPTGIDLDFFRSGDAGRCRRRCRIGPDATIIGHVGRLAREKNLPYLAGAVARTVAARPDTCFLVAGTGNAESEMRAAFADRGLEERLILAGKLTGRDLADCYAAMDCFVFASHTETQGLVLAEAMATGTPVVALSASGVDDVLDHEVNGYKLPGDSTQNDFYRALTHALSEKKRLREWSVNARRTAEKFSRRNSGAKLIEVYEATLSGALLPHRREHDLLESALHRIRVEWELMEQKAIAAVNSFSAERHTR